MKTYNTYNKKDRKYYTTKDDIEKSLLTGYDITNINFWRYVPINVICEFCGLSHKKERIYEYDLVKHITNKSKKRPVDGIVIKDLDGVPYVIRFDINYTDADICNYKKVSSIFEWNYTLEDVVALISLIVSNYPKKYQAGLIQSEIYKLINMFSFLDFGIDKYNDAMSMITVTMIDDITIYPQIDVIHGLYAGYEKRALRSYEFD